MITRTSVPEQPWVAGKRRGARQLGNWATGQLGNKMYFEVQIVALNV
jgi:hypothetical protein